MWIVTSYASSKCLFRKFVRVNKTKQHTEASFLITHPRVNKTKQHTHSNAFVTHDHRVTLTQTLILGSRSCSRWWYIHMCTRNTRTRTYTHCVSHDVCVCVGTCGFVCVFICVHERGPVYVNAFSYFDVCVYVVEALVSIQSLSLSPLLSIKYTSTILNILGHDFE